MFCKELTKIDPIILDVVRDSKILFILLPRQSRLPNLCDLTKEGTDLVG